MGSPRGVVAYVLDCEIVLSAFELPSRCYIHSRTNTIGWLVGFYRISTFDGYLMPNAFYMNNQFYFKQFSLAWVHS